MSSRRFQVSALALAGLLSVGAAAHAATLTQKLDKSYPVQANAPLELQNTNGSVVIEAWDRNEVHVVAVKKVKAGSEEKAKEILAQVQIAIQQKGGGLQIATRLPRKNGEGLWEWMSGSGASVSVEYRLQVPRQVRLDIETTNGGLRVKGTRGEGILQTTNGGITLADVDGDLRLQTTNGGIEVSEAAGAVQAVTTNGGIDVSLREVPSGSDLSFNTTNGAVEVRLPRDIRASIDVSTSNGRISSAFEVEGGSKSRNRLTGNINGGGGQLKIRTTNGSVEIAQE